MIGKRCLLASLVSLLALAWLAPEVLADVSPGDVIDETNWQKTEGLLPEAVVNWVKRGDVVLDIRDLDYDPKEFFPPDAKESLTANRGLYGVAEDGTIVDLKTGRAPAFIHGLPFPEIDPDDPDAGAKVMHNRIYYSYALGAIRYPFLTRWVGRDSGFERELESEYRQYPLVAYAGARNVPNPEGIQHYSLILTFKPFDVAGANMLSWRYVGTAEDLTFAYIPFIRRVRRVSPANRSDQLMGSDMCVDDAWGFDGKVSTMRFKLLRKQEALMPFLDTKPQAIEKNEKGEWQTTKAIKPVVYGYQKAGWTGAPWMPTNLVWVKRPAYVIEMTPKDPYYNYGLQYMWIDAEVNVAAPWKVIHDRAGQYWKVVWHSYSGFESADGQLRFLISTTLQGVDDRKDHATVVVLPTATSLWGLYTIQDRNDFSLAGFQKLCK